MKTFYIKTLGCKVNQYESEKIRSILLGAGLEETSLAEADIKIVNTCSVTGVADSKSRQEVNKAMSAGKEVLVTGCAVENNDAGIENASVIPNKKKIAYFEELYDVKSSLTSRRTRPLIQIQDGCPQCCSYCIVPSLRGKKSVSKDFDEVTAEIKEAVVNGYKELVLTGINIGMYLSSSKRLSELLKYINSMEEDFRVRISSIELNALTNKVINEIFSPVSKVAAHLHIPLQSGSDEILKSMNRPYISQLFVEKIKELQERNTDLAISTDVIVGFPGESDKHYYETCQVVEECAFAKVHVFRYSQRPGTPASSFENKISANEKKIRSDKLIKIAEDQRKIFVNDQIDKVRQVVCERKKDGHITGISDNYIRVNFRGSDSLLGKLVSVKILNAQENEINGMLVN